MLLSNKALAMMSRTLCHCEGGERRRQRGSDADSTQINHYLTEDGLFTVTVEKTRHLAPGSVT